MRKILTKVVLVFITTTMYNCRDSRSPAEKQEPQQGKTSLTNPLDEISSNRLSSTAIHNKSGLDFKNNNIATNLNGNYNQVTPSPEFNNYTEKFAQLTTQLRTYQQTSSDLTGGNNDGFGTFGIFNFLYRENGKYVIFDDKNQGTIVQMFFQPALPDTNPRILSQQIQIFSDNVLTYDVPAYKFFTGEMPPFTLPLSNLGNGGYWSYFPLKYSNRSKILTDIATFYHFTYMKGKVDTDTDDLTRTFENSGQSPHTLKSELVSFPVNIPAGREIEAIRYDQAGTILEFRATVNNSDNWKNLWLKIYWDGQTTPAVNIPLGMLFGASYPAYDIKGLFSGMDGTTGYCYLPMPFRSNAITKIENKGTVDASVQIDVAIIDGRYPEPFGHFYAKYNEALPSSLNYDYKILQTNGWGKLIGLVIDHYIDEALVRQNGQSYWYMEGDLRIYVDGSEHPQLHGTSHETISNWGWYDNSQAGHGAQDRPFTYPTHSYSGKKVEATPNGIRISRSQNRTFVTDFVPFHKQIDVSLEHALTNDGNAYYHTAALFYKYDEEILQPATVLDVGNAQSETAHNYSVRGNTTSISVTAKYTGDSSFRSFTDTGRKLDVGAVSTFTVNIPRNNQGIFISCRVDPTNGPFSGDVYVDGTKVGTLYQPGANTNNRFYNTELDVPSQYTSGKDSIKVEVKNNGNTPRNELLYNIYYYTR
ncbi:MAG: DUF2961 domain-containing protein [Planctomycetes bacterium]|nr:DUF2961 domain-containing protein [Planctomycetota bacterium]